MFNIKNVEKKFYLLRKRRLFFGLIDDREETAFALLPDQRRLDVGYLVESGLGY